VKAGGIDTSKLVDGAVTDAKLGSRTLTDAGADSTLVAVAAKTLTSWLQGIRNNLKALFGKFDPAIGHTHNGVDSPKVDFSNIDNIPSIEDFSSYGVEWDTTIADPACTRIGNLSLHRSLPIQNRMKGCLLSDNGQVVEYLTPNNWLAHDRSGASGQVMVEIPAHYRKFETDGTRRRALISEYPLQGFHFVPKTYISAYEAAIERSSGKLCSVVNMDADFRGGDNNADLDGTYRSLLGRPVTKMNRIQHRPAARMRGAGAQWNMLDYNAYKALVWLYYIEYANRNCQLPFNAQADANGYKQGGLGNGATTLSDAEWNNLNEYRPFIPCGHTDELGNGTGEVAYDVDINGDSGNMKTVYANRYRGIENPFGHIWKWSDGINVEIKTDDDGGTSKVYVCDDPSKYSDNGYNGYEMRGLEARTEGYTKEMIFGEKGDIIPSVVGGGSAIYWCDYHYSYVTASSLRGMMFGGTTNNGSRAGFCFARSVSAPTAIDISTGTRLCFIPEN
jgi:hypothetical protein